MSVIKTDLLQNRLGTSHPAVTKADFVKAWGVVNQTGTQALGEQFNITSVTDGGVGVTTFTYAAGFVTASSQVPAGMNFSAQVTALATRLATGLTVHSYTIAAAPTLIDSVMVSFAAMGTLA